MANRNYIPETGPDEGESYWAAVRERLVRSKAWGVYWQSSLGGGNAVRRGSRRFRGATCGSARPRTIDQPVAVKALVRG